MQKEYLKKRLEKKIAQWAGRTAGTEANSACPCLGYQPKEPQDVKKLRRF